MILPRDYSAPRSVKDHAVDRYIERVRAYLVAYPDGKTFARSELERLLSASVLVQVDRKNKQTLWRLPEGALLVVDQAGVVRTVLAALSRATVRRPVRHAKGRR